MKKNILYPIAYLFILSFTGTAQTITALDCNPQIGEVIEWSLPGYSSSLNEGPAGLNQEWYFSELSLGSINRDTVRLNNFEPGVSFIPNATVIRASGNIVKFLKLNSTGIEEYGQYYYSPTYYRIKYSNPVTRVRYPIVYGDTYSDQSSALSVGGYPGYTLNINSTATFTVDATGILHTPGGTFTNTIRVHRHLNEVATPVSSTNTISIVSDTYDWYAAGFHEPLLSITTETFGTKTPTKRLTTIYGQGNTLGFISPVNDNTELNLYPNPAGFGEVSLIAKSGMNMSTIAVFNSLGQTQTINYTIEENTAMLDPINLSAGIYLVVIQCDDGRLFQRRLLIEK